jgi:hypothetical protein
MGVTRLWAAGAGKAAADAGAGGKEGSVTVAEGGGPGCLAEFAGGRGAASAGRAPDAGRAGIDRLYNVQPAQAIPTMPSISATATSADADGRRLTRA